jgi:hypothetical protein
MEGTELEEVAGGDGNGARYLCMLLDLGVMCGIEQGCDAVLGMVPPVHLSGAPATSGPTLTAGGDGMVCEQEKHADL